MKAKPTLGFASQSAAVLAMRDDGVPAAAIARRMGGIPTRRVTALEQTRLRRTVNFPRDVLDLLTPHAEKRGVKATTLALRIVATVVDEGLVDAVLDDALFQ